MLSRQAVTQPLQRCELSDSAKVTPPPPLLLLPLLLGALSLHPRHWAGTLTVLNPKMAPLRPMNHTLWVPSHNSLVWLAPCIK